MRIVVLLAALLALCGSAPRREIPLGGNAVLGVVFAHGSLWAIVSRAGPAVLVRVDPATGRVATVTRSVDDCCEPVPAASGVWLGGGFAPPAIVNAGPHGLGRKLRTGSCVGPFAIAAGAVWRVDGAEGGVDPARGGSLCRTDLKSALQRSFRLPAPAIDVAAAGGRIWVGLLDGSLLDFDARRAQLVTRLRLGDYGVIGLAARGSDLWAANGVAVYRIDGPTGRVLQRFGDGPDFFTGTLVAGPDGVFVLDGRLRIRRVGSRGVRPIGEVIPQALTLAGGALWTAVRPAKLVRIQLPLRTVIASHPSGSSGTCSARDLRGSISLQGATGSLLGGVSVVNVSGHSCTLVGRPPIRFSDGQGRREPVVVSPGRGRRLETLVLKPRQRGDAYLQWLNWCGARHVILIVVGVRGGELRLPYEGPIWPRCDGPRQPSAAYVAPWQRD